MTLVVARIHRQKLSIVSDTLLTTKSHGNIRLRQRPEDGTIKSIILNQHQCLSFAGNTYYARQALMKINRGAKHASVIETLIHYTKLSSGETDFIFAFYNGSINLCRIKNGEVEFGKNFNIGDTQAIEYFQRYYHKDIEQLNVDKKLFENKEPIDPEYKGIRMSHFRMWITPHMEDNFSDMSKAMDDVLYFRPVDTVGGFKVHVVFDRGNFVYKRYQAVSNEYMVPGKAATMGLLNAATGSYYINFAETGYPYSHTGLYIREAKIGIIYCRGNFGLMKPLVLPMTEVDFADLLLGFNSHLLIDPDARPQQYINHSEGYFSKGDNDMARFWLEKAMAHGERSKSAYIYWCLALVFHNMGRPLSSELCFEECVSIDENMREKVRILKARSHTNPRSQ